jgi:hypothetical protein
MADDEFVQRAKKNGIAISQPPTPNEDPTTSYKITNSPVPQREKKDTTPTANSKCSRQEQPLAEPHAYATSQRSFSDDSAELFENDTFVDERAMEVQREIQRVRDEGERRKQEYDFIIAQCSETQRMQPAYHRWVGLPHPVDTGIRREVRPAVDPYAMRLLNEQYDKQYPFSPTQISDDEENTNLSEYQLEGGEIGDVPGYTYTIDAPNGFSSLYGATFDLARIVNPAPGKLDPKALAFRPSLKLETAWASNQVNGQKSTPAEADKLDPAAQAFNPTPKFESARHANYRNNNESALTRTDRLDPKALSFCPSPRLETAGPTCSYYSDENGKSPSEAHEEAAISKRKVIWTVKKAMHRHIGNPDRVDWHGKAVLIRIKGHVYSAQLAYVGLSDVMVDNGSQDLDV